MSELQLILLLFCILFGLVSTTDQNPVKVDTATTVVVSQHAPNPDSKKLLPSSSFIPEGNNLHNEVYPNSTGLLDDRTSDLMLDAKNSLKVFFKSLHANRSLEESFAIAVTTFANSRSARLISTQKFMLSRDMTMSSSLGLLALGGLAVLPPLIFPKYFRSMDEAWVVENRQIQKFLTSSLVGVSESMMGWVEKSVDDLPSFPRLDAQECMKRSICEAHNQPKKYGLGGLILQLFFPPYTETEQPTRIVSKYQLAARYGRQDNANCAAQYDGCVVNLLDMIQGVINFFF